MSQKSIVMIFFVIGSSIGSYAPMLFGISAFSMTSVLLGAVGGIIGVIIGFKLSEGM